MLGKTEKTRAGASIPRPDSQAREWLDGQVARYRELFPLYEAYARTLEDVLENAAKTRAPLAIVQSRVKSIASFAEKALRKSAKYRDPVSQLTDLCGARVITRTRNDVDAFSEWIKAHFEIDWDNSVDTAERLKPTEFGYRSVHYIVALAPRHHLGVEIAPELYGLKAEVQVRTTVEHAWADFGHDVGYKGAFQLPAKWERELAVIAAQLENVDQAFSRIEDGLKIYATSYGAYLSEQEIEAEIAVLETVLEHDEGNAVLAWRIGKLALTVGDWAKAVAVMSRYVDPKAADSAYQPLLRDLGVSLCKLSNAQPQSRDYRRGQRYLELASSPPHRDPDALASLAGTWKDLDREKACALYRKAFELDPTDYYPLGNFLECELRRARSTLVLVPLRPVIGAALERCRAWAEVGINLPWAYFGIAKLHLLLGEAHESLRAYARAIQASTAPFMIEGALESLNELSLVRDELEGYDWARRLLILGMQTKFPTPKVGRQLGQLRSKDYEQIKGPVVIVVGGTHPSVEQKMKAYKSLVLEAFRDFRGTIVSGGTRQGVGGLVGELGRKYSERIWTIGYLPKELPRDATLDDRYSEQRWTSGKGFTPLEPLQNWIDLIGSRIDPKDVKVLGINGGDIAAIEFRIALALGASVGVIEESGRAAARLLADEAWAVSESLVPLPEDPQTVRAFIGSGRSRLPKQMRETIGKVIHEEHAKEAVTGLPEWNQLERGLQESSRLQADHTLEKLKEIGCSVRRVSERKIALMTFTDGEVEVLAEMEHGRWNAERLSSGWTWGPEKDLEQKVSPSLVSWADLPEEIREWDRATVRKIPIFLETVGLEIYRNSSGHGELEL